MEFEDAYRKFMQFHTASRSGERLRRLQGGYGHAEQAFLRNVWWPAFGHFDGLHPEYEIRDYNDKFRYLDFAYIQRLFRIAIEVDGFGPHVQNASRWQYTTSHRRQNQVLTDGWHLLRFTYDDVQDYPRICQQAIQQLLGRLLGQVSITQLLSLPTANEREVVRLALQSEDPFTPSAVRELLNLSDETVHKLLHQLVSKQWLQPARGTHRIRSYVLHPSKGNIML
jgi:hypothetical protein